MKTSFWHKRPTASLALVSIFLLLLMGGFMEIVLRFQAWRPGILQPDNHLFFHFTDSLCSISEFDADGHGIMKIKRDLGKEVEHYLQLNTIEGVKEPALLYVNQFWHINNGKLNNSFGKYVQNIKSKNTAELAPLECDVLQYCNSPINEQGFRSIPFNVYENEKNRVLLLGDSFAFGNSAKELTDGFAERLLAKGYAAYNTGINGADPAQYLAIAQQYIPLLKPDVVVVNFYMGNDIVYEHRKPQAGQVIYHATNAGNLYTHHNGKYLPDMQTTYDFIISKITLPTHSGNLFNRFCSKTVLFTRLWMALRNIGLVDDSPDPRFVDYKQQKKDKPVTAHYLKAIRELCHQHQARFLLVAIPNLQRFDDRIPEDYLDVFEDLPVKTCPDIKYNDYVESDGHFNDEGHRKYAECLDEWLGEIGN